MNKFFLFLVSAHIYFFGLQLEGMAAELAPSYSYEGECADRTILQVPYNVGSPEIKSTWRGLDMLFARGKDIDSVSADFSLPGICLLNKDMPNRNPSQGLIQASGSYASKKNDRLIVLLNKNYSWEGTSWPISNQHCDYAKNKMQFSARSFLNSDRVKFDYQDGLFSVLSPSAIMPEIYQARTVPGGIIVRAGWDRQNLNENAVYCAFPDKSSAPEKKEICADSLGVLRDGNASSSPRECDRHNVFLLTQLEATDACPLGKRLPSVLELAALGESWGADGIARDGSGSIVRPPLDADKRPFGKKLFTTRKADGSIDGFYYGYSNFKAPKQDWKEKSLRFWSSSPTSDSLAEAFVLSSSFGSIEQDNVNSRNAVLCLPASK
jgi:hypothetical protein